ncbi:MULTISPECIES: hypothetical protein [unclassified Variovorax]
MGGLAAEISDCGAAEQALVGLQEAQREPNVPESTLGVKLTP